MQYELYTALKTQIETLTSIKHVDLWNNQPSREAEERTFNYPAVFVEFANINYKDHTQGVQAFTMDVNLHLCVVSYENTELNILQLKQNLHGVVHTFQQGYNSKMLRRSDVPNYDHNNLQVWTINYACSGKDFFVNNLPQTSANVTTIDLTNDPIITNHIINTASPIIT